MLNILINDDVKEMFENVDAGIQIVDRNGSIFYCNNHVLFLDHLNIKKVIGRHITEVYTFLDSDTSTILKVIETGKPIIDYFQTFMNDNGSKITTVNTTLPIKVEGKIEGVIEISKDVNSVKELARRIANLEAEPADERNEKTADKSKNSRATYTFADIIGQNKHILELKSLAFKAARTSSPVLIYGETGTGKELFVQAIHNASLRKDGAFIAQNCAALPATLLEGILFGTVRGGFTGADNRPGLFELADGGTLFLDEIDSMPIELQAKLLRVLQDGCVRRIGDVNTINVDVRLIASTSCDPLEAVKNGQFREDLYYRLNVMTLRVPHLRERKDDIMLLTNHFILMYNRIMNKNVKGIEPKVQDLFYNYSWPGNVRELQHVIEGAMNMVEGHLIGIEHLPRNFEGYFKNELAVEDGPLSLNEALEQVEKEMIFNALEAADLNISKAARILDIPRQTLQYKMSKYGIR